MVCAGEPPSLRCITNETANSATRWADNAKVVRGGRQYLPIGESPKPTAEKSAGQRNPASLAAAMRPKAIASLMQIAAVTFGALFANNGKLLTPPSKPNSVVLMTSDSSYLIPACSSARRYPASLHKVVLGRVRVSETSPMRV